MDRQAGFTVLEWMAAITILSIVLAVGIPSFNQQLEQSRLTAATNSLLTGIHFARTEALRIGQRVVICTSADQQTCQPQAAWHDGWIIFPDPTASGQPDGPLLRVHKASGANITITGNQPVANYISYTPDGRTKFLSGAMQMGTITLCGSNYGRQLVINHAGRVRTVRIEC
ncbi:MAG TPA: prepilin-type N-terminal cleavage/methylation domain-containing protein [Halothiobacillaceae bacterium]|nr:prepilin-type N-terminal cleavage/methylation domain-containing protein [Halothiobacillaceae bacterium]